ncbi:hypothetical protein, partial [Pseudomonas aeruginosa]|uniref:hypothetical protein n=2 Tax=Pseudomonas aeruginosa TaxID=287 RepID=UPI001ABD4482
SSSLLLGTIFKTNSRASLGFLLPAIFPFEPCHPPPLAAAPTPEMKTGRMRSPFRHRPAIRLRRMDGAG